MLAHTPMLVSLGKDIGAALSIRKQLERFTSRVQKDSRCRLANSMVWYFSGNKNRGKNTRKIKKIKKIIKACTFSKDIYIKAVTFNVSYVFLQELAQSSEWPCE